jgi:hypothetical protein
VRATWPSGAQGLRNTGMMSGGWQCQGSAIRSACWGDRPRPHPPHARRTLNMRVKLQPARHPREVPFCGRRREPRGGLELSDSPSLPPGVELSLSTWRRTSHPIRWAPRLRRSSLARRPCPGWARAPHVDLRILQQRTVDVDIVTERAHAPARQPHVPAASSFLQQPGQTRPETGSPRAAVRPAQPISRTTPCLSVQGRGHGIRRRRVRSHHVEHGARTPTQLSGPTAYRAPGQHSARIALRVIAADADEQMTDLGDVHSPGELAIRLPATTSVPRPSARTASAMRRSMGASNGMDGSGIGHGFGAYGALFGEGLTPLEASNRAARPSCAPARTGC